jgi:hypothetical protein
MPLVDEKEPVLFVTFAPAIPEDGSSLNERSYTFNCRAIMNPKTETLDIDILFTNEEERREYAEFEEKRKSGVEYYADLPDLR